MSNKCKIFKKGSKQSGITLVALVVTVVILLILAGISIRLVLDNNGIIKKSEEGKEKYGQAKENEQTDLDNALDWIEDISGPSIVEPENIDDWEYKTEDDGTLTITAYKGNATELVIPNSIKGIRVKRIYGADGRNMGYSGDKVSIWDNSICSVAVGLGSNHTGAQNITKKIKISKGIEEIGDWALTGTVELEDIEIPSSVKYIGVGAFWGCFKLKTNIKIPVEQDEIFPCTFMQCENLTNITIPDSVTSIGNDAFNSCISLTNITLPDSVTSIGDSAFHGCENLIEITIPDSVTSIDDYGFYGCKNLTEITIPDSVIKIGQYTFRDCSNLTEITIPNSVTSMGKYAFDTGGKITVNVPFKKGKEPSGWNSDWNSPYLKKTTITVNYKE